MLPGRSIEQPRGGTSAAAGCARARGAFSLAGPVACRGAARGPRERGKVEAFDGRSGGGVGGGRRAARRGRGGSDDEESLLRGPRRGGGRRATCGRREVLWSGPRPPPSALTCSGSRPSALWGRIGVILLSIYYSISVRERSVTPFRAHRTDAGASNRDRGGLAPCARGLKGRSNARPAHTEREGLLTYI